jgi:non-ribosomal peptide synthetase component E (peptide arylation enzyme)
MPTIGGTALLNANRVGEREAIVTAERRWTWRELETDIANAAAALAAFGLRERDRIAILAANSPEFIIACLISRLPRYGSTAPLASPTTRSRASSFSRSSRAMGPERPKNTC